MSYETIQTRLASGIATITLNRPKVHNAINQQMVDELHAALGEYAQNEDVRALVLTSAGGKAFMSGADIAELRNRGREDALKGINSSLFSQVERFPRPTVAAIVGWCLGGGLELALACDFRVAGESSGFGSPEVGLGIMAAAGATRRLPALVGLRHARRLLFTAQIINASGAKKIGLVDKVVPDVEVVAAAHELLEPILKQGPEAVKQTKRALLAWLHGADEDYLMKLDNEIQAELFEHPDKLIRMGKFLEKRRKKYEERR